MNHQLRKKDFSILRFTFDRKFAHVLKDYGFSALSLANNHSMDFGQNGMIKQHIISKTLVYISLVHI